MTENSAGGCDQSHWSNLESQTRYPLSEVLSSRFPEGDTQLSNSMKGVVKVLEKDRQKRPAPFHIAPTDEIVEGYGRLHSRTGCSLGTLKRIDWKRPTGISLETQSGQDSVSLTVKKLDIGAYVHAMRKKLWAERGELVSAAAILSMLDLSRTEAVKAVHEPNTGNDRHDLLENATGDNHTVYWVWETGYQHDIREATSKEDLAVMIEATMETVDAILKGSPATAMEDVGQRLKDLARIVRYNKYRILPIKTK